MTQLREAMLKVIEELRRLMAEEARGAQPPLSITASCRQEARRDRHYGFGPEPLP
jgi:hypothetical protein